MSNADTKAEVARRDHDDVPPQSTISQIDRLIRWKRANRHTALLQEAGYFLLGLISLAAVTGLYFWLDMPLVSAAFTYLLVLVLLCLVSKFSSLAVLSFVGVGCLSYFFAFPIYSFRVDYPQDLITISAFVITSFVVNFLVTRVRAEQRDHMTTSEMLRDANRRLEVTNKALQEENVQRKRADQAQRESEDKLRRIVETVTGLTWPTRSDGSEAHKAEEGLGFFAQLQSILNLLPAYTWYAAPRGALTFVNTRTAEYLGIPNDHPLRFGIDVGAEWDHSFALLHPDDREDARKYWSSRLRTGEGGEHSYRVRSDKGDYRWFLTRMEPLRASDGTLLLWLGATLDIEELKCAEQALRESEYKLRQVIDTVPSLLWTLGPDGEQTQLNQRALDYIGVRFEDRWPDWTKFVHPDDLSETAKAFSHAIQTGTSYDAVHRLRRADGEYRWHQARGEPLRDKQGRIVQWYGLTIDIDKGKQAEDRLRRSEAYLAEAQRLSHTGSGVFTDTEILYWSEEACRIWGFDPVQGLPSRVAALQRVHSEDVDRVNESLEYIAREKKQVPIEFRIVLPDGTVRHIESTNHPVLSASGEFREIFATGVDVTERKRTEQALRERETKIRRLVDANIIGIFIWDFEGRILEANKAFLHLLGYDQEDLDAGRIRWTDLTPPEWRDRDTRLIQEHKVSGALQPFEKEYFRKDGSRVPVLMGVATFEEGGDQGVAFVLDLTERKRAEAALVESEHKLHQIIDTVPIHLWSASPAFEPTHMNKHLLDYFGKRFEEFTQRGWEASIHPDDLPETAKALSQAVQTGTYFQVVHRLRRADGEFRWHHARGEPLRDREGRIIQWYGVSVDIDETKKAEDRLRRSEAHLAEAQRLSHTGASVFNETTILYWSDESYRIWGFDPAQGVPTIEAASQRIHPDDQRRVRAEAERGLAEKRIYSIAYRIVLPDGTTKHVESMSEPVFSASGELIEILSSQIDVTERKRTEAAIRESEARFRDFAETASDWFWETGPDHKFTLLTENAFGSQFVDRIGTVCWDRALDHETEPEKWRLLRATLESRKPFRDFVYRSVRGDGTPIYVRASGRPVFDANGEFRGYRGTDTDVTEITRAQEALRESERRSSSALDGIAGLVAVLAANGELEAVNRQVFEYFGRPLEWLKQWGANDAVHSEDLPRVLELIKTGLAFGGPFNYELRLQRFDGEYRWFDARWVPLRDDSERVARWYALLTDIEDRTRALARLEQMQSDFAHMNRVSMMGELAASLSHEITQPIAAARNYARAALNFLDQQPPDLVEIKKQLGSVVGAADRSREIIGRVRDHIKKSPPRKAYFDLNHAIVEVIALARSAIARSGVLVETFLSEELAPVEGDRVQLQQVVLNLVLNAVEAMGAVEAGQRLLVISTEQDQAKGVLAVRDSGPGILPENLERVFEAFYTTKTSGMGMGLSICRSIVDAHGGRLWAGVNEPHGAVFQFTLPRS